MCLPIKPFRIEREWKHRGLSCAVVLAREAGHRCGYVRVPQGHPYHGEHYDDALGVHVHGGLTLSELEPCTEHEDGQGWWFGFDCAHAGDCTIDPQADPESLSPEGRKFWEMMRQCYHPGSPLGKDHYWSQAEVEKETEKLARQLEGWHHE